MKSRVIVTKWDKARAQVFARDNAICAYRGVSVWILDLGAVPFVDDVWTDHIELASKGGSSDAGNLVCASASANWIRNRNPTHPPHYFFGGKPTTDFFDDGFDIGPALRDVLSSRRQVHATDWYFNQALTHVVGVIKTELYGWKRDDGKPYHRTPTFWLNAAVTCLQKWRLALERSEEAVGPFEQRGLVRYPHLPETKKVLRLRKATKLSHVRAIKDSMYRDFARNSKIYYGFLGTASPRVRSGLARTILKDQRIHPEVKRVVRQAAENFGSVQGPLYVED